MSIQKVSSYVSPISCWRYDVFLSFRGEDTRTNFIDHLYTALKQKGINVFRDDNELERGKSISLELFKVVEESRFSIIVFSRNFAYSTWCLDELAKIVECKNKSTNQQIVFPIFYDVEPTIVRKQIGNFEQAFANHEDAFRGNIEKVKKWRDALKEVANISGWELKNKSESKIIEDIVKEISSKLIPSKFETHKEIIGLNSRMEELKLLLDTQSDDVRMIGIYGMGGLGKTTTARVIYDLFSCEFEGSSFLANVREISEKGDLISLQKQLLCDLLKLVDSNICNVYEGINMIGSRLRRKKVLLIIDDVVDIMQLESLVGKHDWFALGSRIIITSRDKHLLMTHGVDEVYKLKELNDAEALQLFCMKAFKAHQPIKEYGWLSKRFLKYASGLPLAIKVLGSFLYGRPAEEWESALQRLKRDSTNQIMKILEISFDGLQETEKKIFLDIACFFKGKDRDYITKILDGCTFDPITGIPILIEKSLISISGHNIVWMHDLLQQMGQLIVKKESEEPGGRSRLWEKADVGHLLSENTGTNVMEGIILNYSEDKTYSNAAAKSFTKMTNLRLLKIWNVELPEGLEYLSSKLRLLEWHGYPLESLPSNLQLDKTIELSMCYSNIKQMLNTSKPLNNMKFMRFSHSKNLIKTPDFTGLPNLEVLNLEGCTRLCEIHPSLLVHGKLIFLSLQDCTSLMTLPCKIHMGSVRTLILSGCLKLRKFPEVVGSMECLSWLLLDGTAIKELSLPIELLSGLVLLNLKGCKNLLSLPSAIINGLKCLETLNLSGCSKLRKFPEIDGRVECLSNLSLGGTAIEELPLSIELLSGLALLDLSDCKNLVGLPSILSSLKCLKTLKLSGCPKLENVPENLGQIESLEELDISGTAIRQPPSSIFLLKKLKALSFRGCKGKPVPKSWFSFFPINLMPRRGSDYMALVLPSLSSMSSLTKLDLSDCNLGEGVILSDISSLLSLRELNLSKNNFVSLPRSINRLSNLRDLMLEDCKRLQSLPELPSSVFRVRVDGCSSLERVFNAFKSCKPSWLFIDFVNCLKLVGNNDLAFSMLKVLLEEESNKMTRLSIVVPGVKIPKWFIYQNKGSSLTIIRPPRSCDNNNKKFVGYVMCCVFHVHKHPPTVRSHPLFRTHQLTCQIKVDKMISFLPFIHFDEQLGQPVSDHLWLHYMSSQLLHTGWNPEPNHIEFSFSTEPGPGLEVKRCGFHPVYVEDFDNTTNEWMIGKSNDQVFVGSMMDHAPSTSTASLTEYAESEASARDDEPVGLLNSFLRWLINCKILFGCLGMGEITG